MSTGGKLQRQIEIEHKYTTPNPLQLRELLTEYTVPGHTIDIHDIYYDWDDCRLTLNNIWLRKRNTQYELKYINKTYNSTGSGGPNKSYNNTVYNEIDDLRHIEYVLTQYVHCTPPFAHESLQWLQWLHQYGGLKQFIKLHTCRQQYQVKHNVIQPCHYNIMVVIDTCNDIDHSIVEIEINVPSEPSITDINTIHENIDHMAQLLQLQSINNNNNQLVIGKIEKYLMLYKPDHYRLLAITGVLPSHNQLYRTTAPL